MPVAAAEGVPAGRVVGVAGTGVRVGAAPVVGVAAGALGSAVGVVLRGGVGVAARGVAVGVLPAGVAVRDGAAGV
ncbi:MAG: hypothetical protein NTZ05_21010, partial [Chloroflexi bacterium]|nr:hypothetical protein [Chloroflexota bacterium]